MEESFHRRLIRSDPGSVVNQAQAEPHKEPEPYLPASERASHQNRLARRLPACIPGHFFSYSIECRRAKIPHHPLPPLKSARHLRGEIVENGLITGPWYSAHTRRRRESKEAPRGSLVVVKRWEGRGAPLCAKLMRFRIVIISSRCGADYRPPPPTPP